jgi:hypothetical protein
MPKRKTRIIQSNHKKEKSDESQKPRPRKFDQSTFGGKAGSKVLSARRAAALLMSTATLRLTA